jgi:hypothetical protein
VAAAEAEDMPFYLRRFFRVLSSWVHYLKSQVSGHSRPAERTLRVTKGRWVPYGSRRGRESAIDFVLDLAARRSASNSDWLA